jgi:hypothetical protein
LLGRPRESVSAFRVLSDDQLRMLAQAVESAYARRHEEIDAELARIFSPVTTPFLSRALRTRRFAALNRKLLGRDR